jgi:hypothetical protein
VTSRNGWWVSKRTRESLGYASPRAQDAPGPVAVTRVARNVKLPAELPRCGDRATGGLSIVLGGLTLTGKA